LNVVASKCEYIERLRLGIEHLHKCHATHAETVHVHESSQGETVWQGEVEVFKLTGHVRALRCYAWIYEDDSGEHIATVLAVLPVKTALDAVRVHIVGETKKRK
jgi:hypothetical protein